MLVKAKKKNEYKMPHSENPAVYTTKRACKSLHFNLYYQNKNIKTIRQNKQLAKAVTRKVRNLQF